MCIQNAMNLEVYPFEACVKVDDTLPGIAEGLNAGMWTVGLAMTGNEVGLNEREIAELSPSERARKRARAYARMGQAGAHYVVDSIADLPTVVDAITVRLSQGERP